MIKNLIRRFVYGSSPIEQEKFFTKDHFFNKKYIIGEFTYGKPKILFENNDSNLYIGKYCSIAQNVSIFLGGNHRTDWITTYPFNDLPNYFPIAAGIKGHPATKGNVIIGNDVWIGQNVIILSGVEVADGAVIAAGSLVSKNIGPYEIWGGNPAKLIRKRFNDEIIKELLDLKWWEWPDDKVKQNIGRFLQSDSGVNELKNVKSE